MDLILGSIYILVTGAVIFSMAALFLRGEKNIANKMYLVCNGLVAIWCSSQLVISFAKTADELAIAYGYGNIGICFAGAFWVYFSLAYKNDNVKKIKPIYLLPFVMSAFHYVMMASNSIHHLYYTKFDVHDVSYGIFFYTNVIETYLFIVVGAIIIFTRVFKAERERLINGKTKRPFRKRGSVLIVAAVVVPMVLSGLYLSGMVRLGFDFTPLGFAISVILVMLATNKYQFFDMKRELDIATEQLLLEKERNRIAQQVHDTAGHTLTMLQSYMKLTEVAIGKDNDEEALSYVASARELTSKGIKELRESINHLRAGENYELVTQAVMQLADQVKEIPCEVTIQGEDGKKYSHLTRIIYDTVRESITNTLKYAEAGKLDIVIRFQEKVVELMIADDGKGCENINDNNGLRGIRERIEGCKGTVRFVSAKGEGFMTRVKIPV